MAKYLVEIREGYARLASLAESLYSLAFSVAFASTQTLNIAATGLRLLAVLKPSLLSLTFSVWILWLVLKYFTLWVEQ